MGSGHCHDERPRPHPRYHARLAALRRRDREPRRGRQAGALADPTPRAGPDPGPLRRGRPLLFRCQDHPPGREPPAALRPRPGPAADRPGPRGHDDRGRGGRGVARSFPARPALCAAGRHLLSRAQPGLRLRLHRRAGAVQPAGRGRAGRRRGMLRDPGARRAGLRRSRADRAVGVRRSGLRAAAAAARQGGRRAVDHRPAGAGGSVPAGRDPHRRAAAQDRRNRCSRVAARPDHLARAGAARWVDPGGLTRAWPRRRRTAASTTSSCSTRPPRCSMGCPRRSPPAA